MKIKKRKLKRKMNKKAQKVFNVLTEKLLCSSCKISLNEKDRIGYHEPGIQLWSVYLDKNKDLRYQEIEFRGTSSGYYYCRECGNELSLSDYEVEKILKS